MKESDLIWYAVYGSNIDYQRFICYIRGGQPSGCSKSNKGCRNSSLPLKSRPFIFNNELYFAKKSTSWESGGVAFINPEKKIKTKTFGRIYLITVQQFEDIFCQENDLEDSVIIDYLKLLQTGTISIEGKTWYSRILLQGYSDNYPIFTITNKSEDKKYTRPSPEYIKTIIRGLQQTYNFTEQELIGYLICKKGIEGFFSVDMLKSVVI